MQGVMRAVSIAYVAFLTALLWVPCPERLIGFGRGLPPWLRGLMPWAHLLSFLVLAVVVLTPRWPVPRWLLVIVLACYGGTTEIVQSLVPRRTPEVADWFQDLAGIAVGTGLCWVAAVLIARRWGPRPGQRAALPVATERHAAIQRHFPHGEVRRPSWWG
jgi:VanZ family protein